MQFNCLHVDVRMYVLFVYMYVIFVYLYEWVYVPVFFRYHGLGKYKMLSYRRETALQGAL